MFKREMKVNFKSFFIWFLVLVFIFLIVFLIYPSIIDSDGVNKIDEMMQMFPEDLLEIFNMDITSIESAFGWIKTEGIMYLMLIVGCFSGILGSTILLKEENDKTIEYLNCLPIKRSDIVVNKIICGFVYIFFMILLIGIFNFIGLSISGDFDKKVFILISFTPILSSFVIFIICMFLSTFAKKTKKMIGFSLGIVFISYILQMIANISDSVRFLKFFSVFYLADTRNVILNEAINPIILIVSLLLIIIFIILTIMNYNRKEFI